MQCIVGRSPSSWNFYRVRYEMSRSDRRDALSFLSIYQRALALTCGSLSHSYHQIYTSHTSTEKPKARVKYVNNMDGALYRGLTFQSTAEGGTTSRSTAPIASSTAYIPYHIHGDVRVPVDAESEPEAGRTRRNGWIPYLLAPERGRAVDDADVNRRRRRRRTRAPSTDDAGANEDGAPAMLTSRQATDFGIIG